MIFTKRCAKSNSRPICNPEMRDCSVCCGHASLYKDMGADVRVLVRSLVVAVQVERTVVLVLVVVTTHVQHHAGSVVVAVVATGPEHRPMEWKCQGFL